MCMVRHFCGLNIQKWHAISLDEHYQPENHIDENMVLSTLRLNIVINGTGTAWIDGVV